MKPKFTEGKSLSTAGVSVKAKLENYGQEYKPTGTETDSFRLEFESLNLNNCIKKMSLNHIIQICVV